MKIDCIIASFDYADMLDITLPQNLSHFDSITIYTKAGNKSTIDVCNKYGVKVIETEEFFRNNAKFNRGAVYNYAFKVQNPSDWICLLDSDIVLPKDFRIQIEKYNLNKEKFYGARRYNVETKEQYLPICADSNTLKSCMLFRGFGHGYFQLFNAKSLIFNNLGCRYPESYSCSESDWIFRNNWGYEIWDPPFKDDSGHLEKNVRDYGHGLLECLPIPVIHLGITGKNSFERNTPIWMP